MAKNPSNPLTLACKRFVREGYKLNGSRLYLHTNPDLGAPSYRRNAVTFTLTLAGAKGEQSLRETLDIPGRIIQGGQGPEVSEDGRFVEVYAPLKGFWSLFACRNFENLLALIPDDASLELSVALDHETTPRMARAGFHGDALLLEVTTRRGGKEVTRSFILDTSTGVHDTARFGAMGEWARRGA